MAGEIDDDEIVSVQEVDDDEIAHVEAPSEVDPIKVAPEKRAPKMQPPGLGSMMAAKAAQGVTKGWSDEITPELAHWISYGLKGKSIPGLGIDVEDPDKWNEAEKNKEATKQDMRSVQKLADEKYPKTAMAMEIGGDVMSDVLLPAGKAAPVLTAAISGVGNSDEKGLNTVDDAAFAMGGTMAFNKVGKALAKTGLGQAAGRQMGKLREAGKALQDQLLAPQRKLVDEANDAGRADVTKKLAEWLKARDGVVQGTHAKVNKATDAVVKEARGNYNSQIAEHAKGAAKGKSRALSEVDKIRLVDIPKADRTMEGRIGNFAGSDHEAAARFSTIKDKLAPEYQEKLESRLKDVVPAAQTNLDQPRFDVRAKALRDAEVADLEKLALAAEERANAVPEKFKPIHAPTIGEDYKEFVQSWLKNALEADKVKKGALPVARDLTPEAVNERAKELLLSPEFVKHNATKGEHRILGRDTLTEADLLEKVGPKSIQESFTPSSYPPLEKMVNNLSRTEPASRTVKVGRAVGNLPLIKGALDRFGLSIRSDIGDFEKFQKAATKNARGNSLADVLEAVPQAASRQLPADVIRELIKNYSEEENKK